MKKLKTRLQPVLLAFCLCTGMILFPACNKDDEEDNMKDDTPCEQLECLNGGNAIKDVEMGGCRCICPSGYSGANCEIKKP